MKETKEEIKQRKRLGREYIASVYPLELLENLGYQYPNETSKQKKLYGIYKCGLCGTIFKTATALVRCKHTVSCGCYRKEQARKSTSTHRDTKTKLYYIWAGMRGRVTNKNLPNFNNYGGRGITCISEWKSYESFRDWSLANGYSEGLSLDRINNDLGYSPENCRWTTRTVQARNQRIRKDNTSGYKGVSYIKRLNKYQVRINHNKVDVYLGVYKTAEEGAKVYNDYVLKHNMIGCNLNIIPNETAQSNISTK